MSVSWTGNITIDEQTTLRGISLSSTSTDGPTTSLQIQASTLQFLSIVETDRVPLHLIVGAPCSVATANHEAESYLKSTLLPAGIEHSSQGQWWHQTRTDSARGVLVSCGIDASGRRLNPQPRVSEILFYASQQQVQTANQVPTPSCSPSTSLQGSSEGPRWEYQIQALLLSSDLAFSGNEPTPPPSPGAGVEIEPKFLPSRHLRCESEVINVPPTRKRKSVNDALDEATERRLRARRQGGEGVAAAAALTQGHASRAPSLEHRRTASSSHSVPLQTRPLSRASTVTSIQAGSAREPSAPIPAQRSALSRVKSLSHLPESTTDSSVESRNKELISRIVMAGMRLYGVTQSKSRKSRPSSAGVEQLADADADRKQDEEYKLMYHQVYKGTCFAFRRSLASIALASRAEAVRETVDRLLAVFCSDPLAVGAGDDGDSLTPGGRKAFGSATSSAPKDPFVEGTLSAQHSKSQTPCLDQG